MVLFLFALPVCGLTRQKPVDSLYQQLAKAKDDSSRYYHLHRLYSFYEEIQKDSALMIAKKMLNLATKNMQNYSAITCMGMIGYQQIGLGDYAASLNILLKALALSEDSLKKVNNTWSIEAGTIGMQYQKKQESVIVKAIINHMLGNLLFNTGNVEQAELYFREAIDNGVAAGYKIRIGMGYMNLGRCFLIRNKLDSAFILLKQADSITQLGTNIKYLVNINTYFGDIVLLKGQRKQAYEYYRKGINYGIFYRNFNGLAQALYAMSNFFIKEKMPDSSLYYAKSCLKIIDSIGSSFSLLYVNKGAIYQNMYESFLLKNTSDSARKYYIIALEQKDSINRIRIRTLTSFQNTLFLNQLRLQSLEKEKIISDNRNRSYLFIASIILVAVVSVILLRSNRIKQKDNAFLQKTLGELKSTQSQLIQSEKMASLGELTAGIAHEIQNPLNFVNNFSEVSNELLDEMKTELDKGEITIAKEIAEDVKQNLVKINNHGKRADAIVKGMLQHSRSSTGQKELTDINTLCDEYLRLAYHGLRAKDKSFNASFEMKPDAALPKLMMAQQDIGRVILNLISNAFYAVNERKKQLPENYIPTVQVITRAEKNGASITVEDNGAGIPESVQQKIFQPFFTTKPAGEGTGLGLSLSYDIIKAHGGTINMESKEGEGTKFFIFLPTS